ncbi:MAG: T9SS type A sorting domain-containing protein [Bacteroidetes bacterium]|nr:T9SS type A sorting domain-containing protein [Bacteroidota bacterium]
MKTLITFLSETFKVSLLLLVFSVCSQSQTGWINVSTSTNFNSVFFKDPLRGWIAGDSGSVFTSYDGGLSWSGEDSKTKYKLNSIFFLDVNTGYAAGNHGTVIKTTNGGENWSLLITGITYNLNSVFFPSIDTGYALGEKEIRTTNGGITWTDLGLSLSANSTFYISNDTGFYVNSSNIFRTTNRGTSWATTILSGSYNSIYFQNTSTGWTSGSGIRYTTNGGTVWTAQSSGSGYSTLFGINFSDASSGWAVGSIGFTGGNSEIRRTTNSGTNWTGQSSLTTNILRSVSAVSPSTGVTAGDLGTILLTTNSGANWSNRNFVFTSPASPTYNLNSVYFINDNTGWVSGWSGVVSKTTNGGMNWASYSSASFNNINSVYFLDKDTGWITGNGGIIQLTTNGGVNWSLTSIPVSSNMNDIYIGRFSLTGYFGLHKIGWSVGNSGAILKTTNGGINWTSQASPVSLNLYSVKAFSENNAVICCDSGTILKTTNGGLSWTVKVSGIISGALRSVSFADNYNGICGGDSSVVLYTTDQGDTWISDFTGPGSLSKENITSVSAVPDALITFFAVGEGGIIIKSDNGGITWSKQSGGLKTKFTDVCAVPSGNCFISGTGGTILKTSEGGVLPAELSTFNYKVYSHNVELNWNTTGELNNKGFYIERKNPGGIWVGAGFKEGRGTFTGNTSYSFTDLDLESGIYAYRLKQTDFNGNFKYYYLNSEVIIGNPIKTFLYQNYPNPFNPVTTISFDIYSDKNQNEINVKIKIYDVLGKELKTLVNGIFRTGHYKTEFNATGFPSGIYFYMIETGNSSITKSLILLK